MNAGKLKVFSGVRYIMPRWCYGAIVVVLLSLAVLYGELKDQLYHKPFENQIDEVLKVNSSFYVANFDENMRHLTAIINKLSMSTEALEALEAPKNNTSSWSKNARVLSSSDPARVWSLKVKLLIPGAISANLLSSDQSFPDEGNFVGQQLFNQARSGMMPAPKAGKIDNWLIYIARPIKQEDVVSGVLMVEIAPDSLLKALDPKGNLEGRLELLQQSGDFAATPVFTYSQGTPSTRSIVLKTQHPQWTLQFTGGESLLANIKPTGLLFYSVYLLVCAIGLAIIRLIITKYGSVVRQKEQKRSQVDPLDDMFTQKYIRPGSSPQTITSNKSPDKAPAQPKSPEKVLETPATKESHPLPLQVFREYDIRGKTGSEIDEHFATLLGLVLGKQQLTRDAEAPLAVCCDGRESSPALKKALIQGISDSGCAIIDLGSATTPFMNFALATMKDCHSGVMVTASHNPKEDNGFKIIIDNQVLGSEEIKGLHEKMTHAAVFSDESPLPGRTEHRENLADYINHIADDVLGCELRVAIDCGNGIAGAIAPQLFRQIGCEVYELYTDVDGSFPHHDPDPTVPANLADLISMVTREGLDVGLAFDGDGDRVVAVTSTGKIVWPDELLMIFARDIVTRSPGADIVFDVKSTKRLREMVTSYGGRPVMWKTGHANIRRKVKETGAPIGGEFSGHIFFNDRWYGFDDGLYSAARLLEILTLREQSLDDIVSGFSGTFYTPEIKIQVAEEEKLGIIKVLREHAVFGDAHVNDIDGLRVEYPEGWGLIRASNTSAALTLRFEADTQEDLESIIDALKQQVSVHFPDLPLNF